MSRLCLCCLSRSRGKCRKRKHEKRDTLQFTTSLLQQAFTVSRDASSEEVTGICVCGISFPLFPCYATATVQACVIFILLVLPSLSPGFCGVWCVGFLLRARFLLERLKVLKRAVCNTRGVVVYALSWPPRTSQKKSQPYFFNISRRPHVETSSKFSLFSGT